MELTQLKYFKAVADSGRLVRAAQGLFVSPSALSSSISQLEKELGVSLFDRKGNRLFLNPRGELFLHYTNQILRTLRVAQNGVSTAFEKHGHYISYAATTSGVWSEMLKAFMREYPQFTVNAIQIHPEQFKPDLLMPSYTFLFAETADISPELLPRLNTCPLLVDRPMLVLPASHPLADRPSVTLKKNFDLPLYMPTQGSSLFNRYQELISACEIQQNMPLCVPLCNRDSNDERICYDFAASGIGISFTSERSRIRSYPNVRHVLISDQHRPWVENLFWQQDAQLDEDEILFRDFVLRYFAEDRKAVQTL